MSAAHQVIGASVVWQPANAAEAWMLKQQWGTAAVYAAGTTLLRTQWEAGLAPIPAHLIDISRIPELNGIRLHGDEIVIGAMTTLAELRGHELIRIYFPLLQEASRSIAAPSIRNLATLGGNLCSVTGDILPALLTYEAELIWQDENQMIAERVDDWLDLLGVQPPAAQRLLVQIRLKLPGACETGSEEVVRPRKIEIFRKIGRREAFTPSVVTVALLAYADEDWLLTEVKLAAGGGQTRPARLHRCEMLLTGKQLDEERLRELHTLLMEEYEPRGDMFASADYRKMTAANLIAAELWTTWSAAASKE